MPILKSRYADVLVLLAGGLLPLCLAPFNAWWFAPLPLVAYLFLLQAAESRQRFWRSFLFGLGYFGVGASWVYVSIHDYGYLPWLPAGLLTLAFVGGLAMAFALPMVCWHRCLQDRPLGVLLGFPAVWVLDEWYRSWFLTGFPWLYLGYSQTETVAGAWAPVTGVYGISFLISLLAASVFWCVQSGKKRWLPLLVLSFAIGGGKCLDNISWTQPVAGLQQSVSLVQGNVAQQQKWKPGQRAAIRALYRDMSEPLWKKGQLIIWPEAAIPEVYTPDHPFFVLLQADAGERGGGLITGVLSLHQDEQGNEVYYNSLLGVGEASGFYHKRRLVPFGEYVPLEKLLAGLLDFFQLPVSEISLGPDHQENLSSGLLRIASSICYEVTYPELVASQARDADVLLTVSNDTWFGASIGPHQHLQMAQMRARENAREMMRATSNGISAFMDNKGRITRRSPQFQPFVLQGVVQAFRGNTPYQLYGNLPVLIASLLAIVACFFVRPASKQ